VKQVFLIGLIGLTVLMPCIAQQAQAVVGNASRYESQDTVFYASHATLPFGTQVKVTNPGNNKTITVQIGGRIPADPRWLIDICAPAADALGMQETGFTPVRFEVVPKEVKRKAVRKFMQTGPALVSDQLGGTDFTVAHPSIPLTSLVRITNLSTGKQAIAKVAARMSADGKRVIDLSRNLALNLGLGRSEAVMIETVDKDTRK
jgi:rare lipoprotein A (peptidoglycan hydrolase)